MSNTLRVMFLAAEADPIVKVGGLGDVAGSLPPALNALTTTAAGDPIEVDVRLFLPLHGTIRQGTWPRRLIAAYQVQRGAEILEAEAYETELNGVRTYLIGGEGLPADAPVYSADAAFDGRKFAFFSLAALELARILDWIPHVVHANDWHTSPALYALYLQTDPHNPYFTTSKILGLHNLPYIGDGAAPAMAAFAFPPATASNLPPWAQSLPLPLGLLSADVIVAPSPNYAREILTPEFGAGLESFLRTRRAALTGILNGLNTARWDPATDPLLAVPYSAATLDRRAANKAALQAEVGLPLDPSTPLLAMVSRLDHQKGVDLVPPALAALTDLPWQAVILGSGSPGLEQAVLELAAQAPQRVRAVIRYDEGLSHRIYAGADALLIPSRYEPCGLTQMIAMRYGCLPIARATGGLRDTICDAAHPEATGFLFEQTSAVNLAEAIRRALRVYADPAAWQDFQRRGMAQDFSWENSARQYLQLYLSTLTHPKQVNHAQTVR
jgi:starch synthase